MLKNILIYLYWLLLPFGVILDEVIGVPYVGNLTLFFLWANIFIILIVLGVYNHELKAIKISNPKKNMASILIGLNVLVLIAVGWVFVAVALLLSFISLVSCFAEKGET